MRTAQSISHLFWPLEAFIHQFLIPAMSGRNPCLELEPGGNSSPYHVVWEV